MALTRQREWAQVFVARETAKDVRALARQMARAEVKAASVAYATADDLPEAPRPKAAPGVAPHAADVPVGAPAPAARARDEHENSSIWLPPFIDPYGRDSLGRGLDADSIAAAVARDGRVAEEQRAVASYVGAAYRDPKAAQARLGEVVARDGITSTARRIAADPGVLGALQGRSGYLAGTGAREERARVLTVTAALAQALSRLGERQAEAGTAYVASVEAQTAADATPIPRLSETARAAVDAVSAAGSHGERVQAWQAVQGDTAAELRRFSAAVAQRFGAEGVRTMLRAARTGKAVEMASVRPEHRETLQQVARATVAVKTGERAQAAEVQKLSEAQRLTQGRRLKM